MGNELTTTPDGEIVEKITGTILVDNAMAGAMARVEIDSQIATARQYPRSIKTAMTNILSLATLDSETALECIYGLKRGGKHIRGPSIRLAEIIASQWGNCRDAAMVVAIDRVNKLIVAEGAFHDLETNRGTRASVQRRISDKHGGIFSDDMIAVTGNAACAIARRNAILAGVPKAIWRKAVDACEGIIRGDLKTLAKRREAAIELLGEFKLSPDQVFKIMDVKGIEDIDVDDVVTMRVIHSSLKNGEQTVEELLRSIAPDKSQRVTPATANLSAPGAYAGAGVPQADRPAPAAAAPAAANTQAQTLDKAADARGADPSPSLFDKASETQSKPAPADDEPEINDLDVIANDIVARLNAAAGDTDAVSVAVTVTRDDYALLDAPRRAKVDEALLAARRAKPRKAA